MMNSPRATWSEMTTEDFSNGDVARWIAVLPIAAVEQHGPHLPLGTDALIADAYLARVREQLPADLPATFLPVQRIGTSEEHQAFPGTLSLSPPNWLQVLSEIGDSVARAGVRKLVVINSHGGNSEVMSLLARGLRVRHGMLVVTASWHGLGYPDGLFPATEIKHGIHGGDIETSLVLAARPELVRMDLAQDFRSAAQSMEAEFDHLRLSRPAGFGWMTQDINPAGAVGNAAAATAVKGEAALAHGAAAFIQLLRETHRFGLERIAQRPGGAG